MCHEREELEKLELDQLTARRNNLSEEYEQMRKKKEEELEPRLQSLHITTEEMKVLCFLGAVPSLIFYFSLKFSIKKHY